MPLLTRVLVGGTLILKPIVCGPAPVTIAVHSIITETSNVSMANMTAQVFPHCPNVAFDSRSEYYNNFPCLLKLLNNF